jgi:ketosteroid isomerase-like protein/TolB-like protein
MEVRAHGAEVPAWMREMTRDGLNTILSKFDAIHVYSRQKIDFLRDKRQLGELEAAETLGMSKMLSATVTADAGRVTLELELVDIASGLLEATERVEGPKGEFMALQTELALRTVRLLGVKPTPEQLSAIVVSRGNETVNVYRMLSETLGEPPAERRKPAPPPPPAKHPDTSWLAWPASAHADEPREDEDAIRAVLDQYGAALEAKSVERLATLQVEMSEPQREALRRYFDNAGELRVRISDVDLLIEGDEALATFTREDAFLDGGSGRRMRLEVRISGVLTKEQGTWRIRGLRNPS